MSGSDGVAVDLVDALAELRGRLGQERRLDAGVGRLPRRCRRGCGRSRRPTRRRPSGARRRDRGGSCAGTGRRRPAPTAAGARGPTAPRRARNDSPPSSLRNSAAGSTPGVDDVAAALAGRLELPHAGDGGAGLARGSASVSGSGSIHVAPEVVGPVHRRPPVRARRPDEQAAAAVAAVERRRRRSPRPGTTGPASAQCVRVGSARGDANSPLVVPTRTTTSPDDRVDRPISCHHRNLALRRTRPSVAGHAAERGERGMVPGSFLA